MKKNKFIKNLSFAIFAQIISLLSSFCVQFFAPKVLSVEEYAYWQLFLFYVSYINISRIGIIDGIYLKLGGKSREELDCSLLKTKWMIFSILQIIIALIMSVIANNVIIDPNRKIVLLACGICMVLINVNNFFGFLFQAINETNIYSISEIIYNLLWFIAVGIICFLRVGSYKLIICMYVLGQVCAFFYLAYKARFIFSSRITDFKQTIIDMLDDAKCGLPLLVSMYASMLVTGSARLVVDKRWGIEAFGYFSFSMSLTTFLLKFISQVSMVLFPAIRRVEKNTQKVIFENFNIVLAILLPAALIFFSPMKFIVTKWLPQYETSMRYLGILIPICVFDGKMQLLYSTYLKVLRKEKKLLYINGLSVLISFGLSVIGAYIFQNLEFIAWGLLLAIMVRSFVAEISLLSLLKIKTNILVTFSEIFIMIVFAYLSTVLTSKDILLIYSVMYIGYLFLNHKSIALLVKKMKHTKGK